MDGDAPLENVVDCRFPAREPTVRPPTARDPLTCTLTTPTVSLATSTSGENTREPPSLMVRVSSLTDMVSRSTGCRRSTSWPSPGTPCSPQVEGEDHLTREASHGHGEEAERWERRSRRRAAPPNMLPVVLLLNYFYCPLIT